MNPLGTCFFTWVKWDPRAGLSTQTMRPFLQATLVKRAYLDTTRMLPSSQGTHLHPKKLLTRPLRHLIGMAWISMTGSQLYTLTIVSMTLTMTDGARVAWSNAKKPKEDYMFVTMTVILLTSLMNKL